MIATARDHDSKRYTCFPNVLNRRCYYFLIIINWKEMGKREYE